MKRRYADRRNNNDILKKEIIIKEVKEDYFEGYISYLHIIKARNKWYFDEEQRCVLDDGYVWFNIYPIGKNYCINAMMDSNLNVKEWYFDVSKNIGIDEGVPYEDDLYLDVVIIPDGRIHVLDEDEIQLAFKNEKITKEEYDLAYQVKDYILEEYGNNIDKLMDLTNNLLNKIERK